jgi:hypothetical protein
VLFSWRNLLNKAFLGLATGLVSVCERNDAASLAFRHGEGHVVVGSKEKTDDDIKMTTTSQSCSLF